jgi:hypothetical protein
MKTDIAFLKLSDNEHARQNYSVDQSLTAIIFTRSNTSFALYHSHHFIHESNMSLGINHDAIHWAVN